MTRPRLYSADGFRRILPSDRSPGLTEFRVGERTFQAASYGAEADECVTTAARVALASKED